MTLEFIKRNALISIIFCMAGIVGFFYFTSILDDAQERYKLYAQFGLFVATFMGAYLVL